MMQTLRQDLRLRTRRWMKQLVLMYVHDAPHPVLVVNDLKQGQGRIALWVEAGTVAHFANLRVSK